MKITSTALLVFAATSLIVRGQLSLGNIYALKDKDNRYIILTLENVKHRYKSYSILYDEDKDKRIKAVLILIESPGDNTFKFDNDDLPQNVGPETQVITCIEFKNGKGDQSCLTDSFKSES